MTEKLNKINRKRWRRRIAAARNAARNAPASAASAASASAASASPTAEDRLEIQDLIDYITNLYDLEDKIDNNIFYQNNELNTLTRIQANRTDDINTNQRRVEYEVYAMDTIYGMRNWLYVTYGIVSLLFITKYYMIISVDKTGYTKSKMVGMAALLVLIPFMVNHVINILIYLYNLPTLMYPDITP
jgi:hypothetical protein